MIRRISLWTHRHPILSMLIGWLVVVAIIYAVVPPDPAYLDATVHRSTT